MAGPGTDGTAVHLEATITRIEPRVTSQDRPWVILHLTGIDMHVRGLVFPSNATPHPAH